MADTCARILLSALCEHSLSIEVMKVSNSSQWRMTSIGHFVFDFDDDFRLFVLFKAYRYRTLPQVTKSAYNLSFFHTNVPSRTHLYTAILMFVLWYAPNLSKLSIIHWFFLSFSPILFSSLMNRKRRRQEGLSFVFLIHDNARKRRKKTSLALILFIFSVIRESKMALEKWKACLYVGGIPLLIFFSINYSN